jgi:hypothetical protein
MADRHRSGLVYGGKPLRGKEESQIPLGSRSRIRAALYMIQLVVRRTSDAGIEYFCFGGPTK